MKFILLILSVAICFLQACGQDNQRKKPVAESKDSTAVVEDHANKIEDIIHPEGKTVESRIAVPPGFERLAAGENSFAQYLRSLPVKEDNAKVRYYDGSTKENYGVYVAVIDLKIGNNDLHQCADAVMRLRAEYLFRYKQYDKIHFNLTNGFRVDYSEWMQGKRVSVKGNSTNWFQSTGPSNTYQTFWSYMEFIFTYAGTLSLSRELAPMAPDSMNIGDVFIKGGSPGHAVVVVDMAVHSKTGEKIFILAQSYMPAQEIQILQNPADKKLSPWYSVNFGYTLCTPEWTFNNTDLKRFRD